MREWINLVESAQTFPTKSFAELWHIGSMDAAQKRTGSYEGSGLSVSRHPSAWRGIGGGHVQGDTWELEKAGNKFLDYHAMPYALQEAIRNWGIQQGYVKVVTHYRIEYYDDEWEQTRYTIFDTREQAEEELEAMDGDPDDIEEITDAIKTTPKLDARTRNAPGNDLEPLVPVWVEDNTDLDGVWWQDSFDPERLSAPRGVIVPSKVATWSAKKLDDDPYDDEEDSDGPETPHEDY